MNLLRNLNCARHIKKDKWEFYLIKYVSKYSKADGMLIEKDGYLSCKVETKLTIIKHLLESQFDENNKLKQVIAELTDLNSLRSMPIGRDNQGFTYWYFIDKDFSIRLFAQYHNEENSWKIVAK
jgi:hypothetical protein